MCVLFLLFKISIPCLTRVKVKDVSQPSSQLIESKDKEIFKDILNNDPNILISSGKTCNSSFSDIREIICCKNGGNQ